jgi:hypothetical protein
MASDENARSKSIVSEEEVHAKYGASLISVIQAEGRIKGQAHVTPVMTCSAIDRLSGMRSDIYFCYCLFFRPWQIFTMAFKG